MKMNLPNKLTIFRVILVPIFVIIGYCSIPGGFLGVESKYWIMNAIFIIASVTIIGGLIWWIVSLIAESSNLLQDLNKYVEKFGSIPSYVKPYYYPGFSNLHYIFMDNSSPESLYEVADMIPKAWMPN